MVAAAYPVPLAGRTNVPDNMTAFSVEAFRRRCERTPEPWRTVKGPIALGPAKERREAREVNAAKRRPAGERTVRHGMLVRDVEARILRFKHAYTEYDVVRMLSIAGGMRKPVHQMRVNARASAEETLALPPRRSQFSEEDCLPIDRALAWVHHLDVFLSTNDKKPGVPLDLWRRHYQIAPLDLWTRRNEHTQAAALKREPSYKRLDRVDELVTALRADLVGQPDWHTYPTLDRNVRVLRRNLLSLGQKSLPPHWLQYRYAGGFPADNCRVWRTGLVAWLDDYDCVPTYQLQDDDAPPAYEAASLATHMNKDSRGLRGWRRFLLIA